MKHIFIITGQTATGKTRYALELAQQYNGELINCDSRQIYKHLDIITGKDIEQGSTYSQVRKIDQFSIGFYNICVQNDQLSTSRFSIPIWLYDIVDPKDYFSSFDYQMCAVDVMKDILSRGKTPIIVGGTYLYVKHLLYDIDTEHIQPNWELRSELAHKTVNELQTILQTTNIDFYNALNESDRKNPQRLIRKIEIVTANPHAPTQFNFPHKNITKLATALNIPEEELKIDIKGFTAEKQSLTEAIKKRVEKRLAEGAINEVKNLLAQGFTLNDPGMQTIGYQQLIQYVAGKVELPQAIEEWITKEIQYAKRQYTFMKKDPFICWN